MFIYYVGQYRESRLPVGNDRRNKMVDGRISVLIVDDEEIISSLLKDFLEDMGLQVTTVGNGSDALSALKGCGFNAAIVDMRLPDMTGNDLITRAFTIRPEIKYFIHTGSLDYQLPDDLRRLGLTEKMIIHKPVTDIMSIYRAVTGEGTGEGSTLK